MERTIVIRKGLKLGELAAEADTKFLEQCFIDAGYLHDLLDTSHPASVLLGRTGSGKTALLYEISRRSQTSTTIDPHNISVQFLEHSNIIQFLTEIGVKLDLFYRILWKHIIVVELLKQLYGTNELYDTQGLLDRLFSKKQEKDPLREKAKEYFDEFGDTFWLETHEQLKEITERFGKKVGATFKGRVPNMDISAAGAKSLDNEVRKEIKTSTNRVVSGLQIQRLNELINHLESSSFPDGQKRYYVLVDGLDENWASTETRCRFIRALIEEIKSLRKLTQAKVIIALRNDLLIQVFTTTRDAGFQEEKFEAYLQPLQWDKETLKALIEKRINEVFKDQYTGQPLKIQDLFPKKRKGGGMLAEDFILERTFLRPRDVLQFCNECFSLASGRPRISWRTLIAAESTYSSKRLRSLLEEWHEIYPNLGCLLELLRGLPSSFGRSSITSKRIESICMLLCDTDQADSISEIAERLFRAQATLTEGDALSRWIRVMYHVGALAIKIGATEPFRWSHLDQPEISLSEAKRANKIRIHKMLWRALEVQHPNDSISQVI